VAETWGNEQAVDEAVTPIEAMFRSWK